MLQSLNQFISEACVLNPAGAVPVVAFVHAFGAWMIGRYGGRAPTRSEVVAALQECNYAIGVKDGRKQIVGVAFKPAPLAVIDGKIVAAGS